MQLIIVILFAIIFYLLQLRLYARNWNKNLSIQVSYSQNEANIGERIELTETIENRKLLPLPLLYVKFSSSKTFLYDDMNNAAISDHYYRNDIFSISGHQQVIRKQHFTTTSRGHFVIHSIDLMASDLFMHRNYACMYENHASLYVYPKLLTNPTVLNLTSSIIGEAKETRLYEDPLSFRGIRNYLPGDTMNRINWKASAKTGDLLVNTFFDTQNGEIVLLLNLDSHVTQRSYRLTEHCISLAATMLTQFHQANLPYRFAVNMKDPASDELPTSDIGLGTEHYKNLLRILCRLDLHKQTEPFLDFFEGEYNQFTSNHPNTIYIIVSNYRKPLLLDAYEKKQNEGYHLHFICPERKENITPAPFVNFVEVEPDAL